MTPLAVRLRSAAVESLRPLTRRWSSGYARILMYHRFGADGDFRRMPQGCFAEQLRYLTRNFRVVPLRELTEQLAAGKPFARNSVALTVDDGYRDFFTHAYPVIEEFRVPVTVYVVSRFIDQEIWLWFDAIHFLVHSAPAGEFELTLPAGGRRVELKSLASRNEVWNLIADACLPLMAAQRWTLISSIAGRLGVALPQRPTPEYAAMSWQEVRQLDPTLIDIGVHTMNHPILSRCDAVEQQREIAGARRRIEECLGRAADAFCYPNGQPGDFDQTTVEILRRENFSSAVVAYGGMIDGGADRCLLQRLGAPEHMSDFRRCLDGVWELRRRVGRGGTAAGNGRAPHAF